MNGLCRGCLAEIKFGEQGTCWHEDYGHHLNCPINPETEDLPLIHHTPQETN